MEERRYDFCETQYGGTAAEFDCCTEEKAINEITDYSFYIFHLISWNPWKIYGGYDYGKYT